MEFSLCNFGLTLIVVFLAPQNYEAMTISKYNGILNEMPKNCTGKTFCLTKHENYAQENIDNLLTKKYNLKLASAKDEFGERNGTTTEFKDGCEKIQTYGLIYEIIDEENRVRQVVQSPKLFKQIIRIEQCVYNSHPVAEEGDDDINASYEDDDYNEDNVPCGNTPMEYSFLVLAPNGKSVEFVKVKGGIPVCCSCRV